MNSITRPRKRPRVESFTFRSFSWVLIREVAFTIGDCATATTEQRLEFRARLLRMRTADVRRLIARTLHAWPARRIVR